MSARSRARAVAACAALVCAATSAQAAPAPIFLPTIGGAGWTNERVTKLGADLDAMLAHAPELARAHVGVLAIDTASGNVLYARAPDDEFQPASALKLVVGSAALDRLGPQHRFRTALVALGDGASTRLVLRAGGDPLLEKRDLDDVQRTTVGSGIRTPNDDLAIDDTRYDTQPYPAGWTWDDFPYGYAPRVSALNFEENVVHVTVTPTTLGASATVTTAPFDVVSSPLEGCAATANVLVRASVRTAAAGSNADALDIVREPAGCIDIVGTIPLGSAPQTIDAAVPSPLLYAYDYLRGGLRGVVRPSEAAIAPFPFEHRYVPGPAAAPREREVWHHESPPLESYLGPRFWLPSDNLVGEVLLKELGFATAAAPGTTAKGIAYEKVWLRSIGVDPQTVSLADGCGMSQYDRITPRALVAVLQHDWQGPHRQTILAALPVGGARGTIEGIADTPAAGRVFAKTGSMMHVRALAGYLATVRHGAVTFAFTVDEWIGVYSDLAALRARTLARIIND